MIIDEILDRKEGKRFVPDEFKRYVLEESAIFGFKYFAEAYIKSNDIDKEYAVKCAIIKYIVENHYNINLIHFVLKVNWALSE